MTTEQQNNGNNQGQTDGVNPRDGFLKVKPQTGGKPATTEEKKVEPTPELDIKKPQTILKSQKGFHIEEDVLAVFEAEQELRPRGWGSQIVSDWIREKFVEYKLFEKHGIENLKKEK